MSAIGGHQWRELGGVAEDDAGNRQGIGVIRLRALPTETVCSLIRRGDAGYLEDEFTAAGELLRERPAITATSLNAPLALGIRRIGEPVSPVDQGGTASRGRLD